jgi:acetyl-CoA C-acetyltransferase
VWANGGYLTKHSFGVYGAAPPADGFRHDVPQLEIDALPARQLAAEVAPGSKATIEAYTVMFGRDGTPEQAIASCLLADGRRAWATSTDHDTATALSDDEWVGRSVRLHEGALHV